ncbi:MAG: D-alanine--D-alanine ligase [Candidatus Kapaibacteriales bacterium]
MTIGVLLGGLSAERNVSYSSGMAVAKSLIEKGHEVRIIDTALGNDCVIEYSERKVAEEIPDSDGSPENYIKAVSSSAFEGLDCCFIVTHGTYGEDGVLQALLDLKGIPYTGSKQASCAIAMDKIKSKLLFIASGLGTAEWITINPENLEDENLYQDTISALGKNLVVKPNAQGSAIGVEVLINTFDTELEEAVNRAIKFDSKVLIEQYIPGREVTVGVLEGEALPMVEIRPHEGYYDYKNKYQKGKTEYICPVDIPEDIVRFTQDTAEMAHAALGCKDYSRVDFRITDEGVPYLLEVNTVPGFTELSLFPMAAKEAGIEFGDLCEKLIDLAINK